MPLDTLKVDRSFIDKMALSENNQATVGVIIALANRLNLDVTAQGTKTTKEQSEIRILCCE